MESLPILQTLRDALNRPLLGAGDEALTLLTLLGAVAALAVFWVLAVVLRRFVARMFRAESAEEEGAAAVAEPVVYWTTVALGVGVALDVLGAEWVVLYSLLNDPLVTISGTQITLSTVITVAVMVAVAWGISRLVRRGATGALRARGVSDAGTVAITQRLIHYAVMAVGIGVALDTLGIDLAALFAAGAVFAVGIGFAMQNIAQNFVSGLILLVERTIKPGDVVEVEGRVVNVEKMGIRTTVARTRDEEEIIIPNSALVQNAVKNYTLRDSLYRVRATVGVEYGSDMKQVMEVLQRAAETIDWRFRGREPVVFLTEFGDSSVNFEVSVWMSDPWTAPRSRSRLNEAVWFALKDAGITIAFPQLDVHFDEPVEESLRAVPRAS